MARRSGEHGSAPDVYRVRYGLASIYLMLAPDNFDARPRIAKRLDFGCKPSDAKCASGEAGAHATCSEILAAEPADGAEERTRKWLSSPHCGKLRFPSRSHDRG